MKRKDKIINLNIIKRSALEGLMLVVVAALALEASSLVQYYFSQKGIHKEAAMRAQAQLEAARGRISDVINQTESAVHNSEWIAEWCLEVPDSIPRVSQRLGRLHRRPRPRLHQQAAALFSLRLQGWLRQPDFPLAGHGRIRLSFPGMVHQAPRNGQRLLVRALRG